MPSSRPGPARPAPSPAGSFPAPPGGQTPARRERDEGLCLRCDRQSSPAALLEPGRKDEGNSEAKGVRQLLGEGERVVDAPQGLVGIAELPQGQRHKGETVHPGVIAIQKGVGAMLLGIVERQALLQVGPGGGELAQPDQGIPQHIVGHQQELHLADPLGQASELLPQLACRL